MGQASSRWRTSYAELFYQSPTVTTTGNTGVIATPLISTYLPGSRFPLYFQAIGTNMTTDETNIITIDWYGESAGIAAIGTTTFAQLTASTLLVSEAWPGDVTFFNAATTGRIPLLPYMKITHTLAGTTKSMEYGIYLTSIIMV